MLPGMDPKKMQAVMKQMGISQENIDAKRVTIEKTNDEKIVIENPSITKIQVQGNESFQISGDVREEGGISEEDIQAIIEKTGVNKEKAQETLEKTGDLAEAILMLS